MRRRTPLASAMGALAAGAIGRAAPGRREQAGVALAQGGPAAPQGRWVTLAPFPEPTPELAGAAAARKLYAIQRQRPGFVPAGLVYEYDPAANVWTKKKPMPRALHHGATVAFNDRIYLGGDVQSAIVPLPAGLSFMTVGHEAFEVGL